MQDANTPAVFSVFSDKDIATILEIANNSLLEQHDEPLIQKLTILTGYGELRKLQPDNSTYRLITQKVAADVFAILKRKKLATRETDRLASISTLKAVA